MRPPIPNKCDSCNRPITPADVCKRCQAYAFCGERCESGGWRHNHRTSCSAVPSGSLKPARLTWFQEREDEVNTATAMLEALVKVINMSGTNRGLSKIQSATHSIIHQAIAGTCTAHDDLAEYELPWMFAYPRMPGERDPATPYDKHFHLSPLSENLRRIARLFLAHDLATLPAAHVGALFRPPRSGAPSALDAAIADCPDGTSGWHHPQTGFQAKLWGPKVLAVPGGLSVNEYNTLIWHLPAAMEAVAPEEKGRVARWDRLRVAAAVARYMEP